MQIKVIKGDITQLEVDAIVNAANNELRGGGGVDGAIHRAGGQEIMAECREIGYCETGEVVRTTGGRLKVKHLLHTVGPVFDMYKVHSFKAKEQLQQLQQLQQHSVQRRSQYNLSKAKGKSLKAKSDFAKATSDKATNNIQDIQLQKCYVNSIKLAEDLGCKTIAFPNISTGVYGFPKERAVELVFEVMKGVKESSSLKKIVFCCFDEENYQLYQERFEK